MEENRIMDTNNTILRSIEDESTIRKLVLPAGIVYTASAIDYYTSIKVYEENGQMASVTWFALYRGGMLIKRINGAYVIEVEYWNE